MKLKVSFCGTGYNVREGPGNPKAPRRSQGKHSADALGQGSVIDEAGCGHIIQGHPEIQSGRPLLIVFPPRLFPCGNISDICTPTASTSSRLKYKIFSVM